MCVSAFVSVWVYKLTACIKATKFITVLLTPIDKILEKVSLLGMSAHPAPCNACLMVLPLLAQARTNFKTKNHLSFRNYKQFRILLPSDFLSPALFAVH